MKLQTCSACQDLPTLQFWSKFDYPSWRYCPFFINFFLSVILFVLCFKNYLEIDVKFKLQKCAACQDLPTLQCRSKSHYPFWPIMQIRKKGGWNFKKSSPLKLQSQPNFAEMILRWSPFKIVSVSAVLYPRWPSLLKIEISSNGQNCSILSQKVPKFELYKHNDELFNIYYEFSMNFELLPILTDYANLKKEGMKLRKIFSSETIEPISTKFCWNDPWVFPFQNCVHQHRPVSKMAAITKNIYFFKWPKLPYFKPESAQIGTV